MTVGPWREMDSKKLSLPEQRKDYGTVKAFYRFCEMGLSEEVPAIQHRTSEYVDGAQEAILRFLRTRASFLWEGDASVNVSRIKLSTWHKCTKPNYIVRHGREEDIRHLEQDGRNPRKRKRRNTRSAEEVDIDDRSDENVDVNG